MKRFYYVVCEKPGRKYNRQIVVFRHTRTGLEFACKTRKFSTASTPGDDAEVLRALVECGQLPKKWLESSRSECSSGGYYSGPVRDHVLILQLHCYCD